MTVKRYYEKPYETDFTATVLSCEPCGKHYRVTLSETMFYPEGGGQSCDSGILDGTQVLDVQEQAGVIYHTTAQPLEVGALVCGSIDWAPRFDRMQQHTGEHIFSGIAHALYGLENVGFHMGADAMTVDLSRVIGEKELCRIEEEANRAIWSNIPVQCDYPSAEELEFLAYRSKKEIDGAIRIVKIPGFDTCACCGTHVAATGEIGLIKICGYEKFHDGLRITLVCGKRAFEFVRDAAEQNHQVSVATSAKLMQTGDAVRKLVEENNLIKQRLTQLEKQAFSATAAQYAGSGDALLFVDGLTPDSLCSLADAVLNVTTGVVAVFNGNDGVGYRYAVGQRGGDVSTLVKRLNDAYEGRGGGKPAFAQGSVRAQRADPEQFFAK
ncbi:MAG: DHHA1 domain-containing protein [Oscillospiraceae bacterium]|nr:DHHA1 domain-containing protein [Oscillospiraceae bacterium]